MTAVTLIDGREVSRDSLEWREECLARYWHVRTLLGMPGEHNLGRRRAYMARVEREEGAEALQRLRDAFAAAWKSERNAP
jgi:hypothetical protein